MRARMIIVVGLGALILPLGAQAHVSVKPKRAKAGSTITLRLEVENERSYASTVKIDVQLPRGLQDVEPRPPRGWSGRIVNQGGEQRRVVLRKTGPGVRLGPGEVSKRFAISARLPERAGPVAFKVLQTYDNAEIDRWIGPRGSERPGAFVTVTGAAQEQAQEPTPEQDPVTTSPAGAEDNGSDGGNDWVLPVVLTGGGAILIAGLLLWRRRRSQPR